MSGKRRRPGTGADAVAAGAARAASGRATRRRTTPLLADREQPPAAKRAPAASTAAKRPPAKKRPAKRVVTPLPDSGGTVHELPIAAAAAERLAGAAAPTPPADSVLEARIDDLLAFLRRRLTGDYQLDEFGFDAELTDVVLMSLLRPLYRRWFRVEVRGVENIPAEGGALIVANHSGGVALDSLMTMVAVHDEHPQHRHLRPLGADLVFGTAFLGEAARRFGATLAANADAERLLARGELVGVWPEGYKGIGKPFSERYKLQRFGRGGFVSAALRTGMPIVPCAIVGAEETYPMIGNLGTLARLLGLPYLPITPTFPLLGPLGLVPLPTKWMIEFSPPLPTEEYGESGADDPMAVFDMTDQVRQTIQQSLYSLLVQRRSVFF